jgi:membrane associated rhomboid family serine protease
VALILWILLQVFGAFQQVHGFSNVSALAHLGGAGVGFTAWLLWHRKENQPANHRVSIDN